MDERPMTVADLKQILEGLPDDALVILSSDAEGNSFLPMDGYAPEQVHYDLETKDLAFEDLEGPSSNYDRTKPKAFVFFPEHR